MQSSVFAFMLATTMCVPFNIFVIVAFLDIVLLFVKIPSAKDDTLEKHNASFNRTFY